MSGSSATVKRGNFEVVLRLTGLTLADIGRGLGMSRQAVWSMVRGERPASPRLVRDGPVLIAAHLADVAAVRDLLFTESANEHARPTVLEQQLTALHQREGATDAA